MRWLIWTKRNRLLLRLIVVGMGFTNLGAMQRALTDQKSTAQPSSDQHQQQVPMYMQLAEAPSTAEKEQKRVWYSKKHCRCTCCFACCPKLDDALDRAGGDLSDEEFKAACCLPCLCCKPLSIYAKCYLEFCELCGDVLSYLLGQELNPSDVD